MIGFGWLRRIFGGHSHKPGSRDFARDLLNQSWEAYRLARKGRPQENNMPQNYSGTSAILGSYATLDPRVRDLHRNTAQARRIVTCLVDLIIGSGIQTYSWPFAPSEMLQISTELQSLVEGTIGPRLAYALESDDLFEQWFMDAKEFDVEGRQTGLEMYRMLLGECIQVGNGYMVRKLRKTYRFVPLAYQLFEREQLDMQYNEVGRNGKNRIIGGIEIDADNRPVAYYFFENHPNDSTSIENKRTRITADRVIDMALFSRPSAVHGNSWLDAIGQSIYDRDNYMDSEIRSAALAAAFALIHKLKDSATSGNVGFDDGEDDEDEYGNSSVKLGHSPIATTIEPDESVEIVDAKRPNKDAKSFIGLLDHDIAGGTGLSYYSLTGDYAATSFSSTRAAKLDEDMHVTPLQTVFAHRAALPVRRDFNAHAAAAGLFSSVSPSAFKRNQETMQRFDAIGSGRDLLDPEGEIKARIDSLRCGLSTFREECARKGKHWIKVLMQKGLEKRIAPMFGYEFDFSLGGSPPKPAATDKGGSASADKQTSKKA